MVCSVEAYRKLIKHLDRSKIVFHTYQIKQDRAYRVVIKNLHYSTNVDDIRHELLTLGHDSRNIINIKNRFTKQPLSMFYVDLEPKENNKEIYNIVHLNNNIIKIEPPRKTNELIQCHRCQQFGHTKSYCSKPFKCVKCALEHATIECKKDNKTPPKCVHCLENHTANYKGCSVYKELLKKKSNSNFTTQSRQNRDHFSNDMPTHSHNSNQNFYNQGPSYADVCKSHSNNENILLTRIEKMLEKQADLISTLTNMMSTLISKLCK